MRQTLTKADSIPFTIVANDLLCDPKLSMKAKGLWSYLYSKPDDWDFNGDRIKREFSDGRRAIFNTLLELEKAGYLQRVRQKDGRMNYQIRYNPLDGLGQKPLDGFSKEPKPQVAETDNISNTEKESNTDEKQTSTAKDVAEVIDGFKVVDPSYRRNFGRLNQRAAAARLLEIHGKEKLLQVIAILPQSNRMPYVPSVTTPIQLEEKWGLLEAALHKKKAEFVKQDIKNNVIFS